MSLQKGKITGQILNNFTIIKSITISLMYISRLKKKSPYFSLLSHTLIIYFKCGNTLLSSLQLSSLLLSLFYVILFNYLLEGSNTLLSSLLLSLFHVALLGYFSLCGTSFFETLQHQTKLHKFSLICALHTHTHTQSNLN